MTERAQSVVNFDADDRLLCPTCRGTHVHVDNVFVAGRPREDGPVVPVHVDSAGRVASDDYVPLPIPEGEIGRRHTISLTGWCEECSDRFALEFKQHKGNTLVAVRRQSWS